MKKAFSSMIGTMAVAAMVGLPSAVMAAPRPATSRALSVDGQIEQIQVNVRKGVKKDAIGVVTPEGVVYVLTPSRSTPAAYKEARKDAARQDWYEVSGRTGRKDGMPSLTVQKISET